MTSKMTSLLSVACVPVLLLLVSGATINQPTEGVRESAPSLDWLQTLSILLGRFSNNVQVQDEVDRYGTDFNDVVLVEMQPLDIPALNQYFPFLFKKRANGVPVRVDIVLNMPGQHGDYVHNFYNLNDEAKYRSGTFNMAELTMDDLVGKPVCTGELTRVNDVVIHQLNCATDNEGDSATSVAYHRCDSAMVVLGQGNPEKYPGIPYIFKKIQQYSLPPSWLEGVDNYINPCAA